jgi:hypothetical protein
VSLNKHVGSHVDGVSHRGRVERVLTRVFRNDWSALTPPDIGEWTPDLSVSVVIPARGGQDRLDLTLAALAGQTYPEHLVEVLVVDDHSRPPLRLPELRPRRCRVLTVPDGAWGAGYATEAAAAWMRRAFDHLDLPRLISITVPANTRSIAVMRRLGFTLMEHAEHEGLAVVVHALDRDRYRHGA